MGEWRAAVIGGTLVLGIVAGLLVLSYAVSEFLPLAIPIPISVRIFGGGVVLAGVSLAAWTFRYRSPGSMIVSTYFTLAKAMRRFRIDEMAGRDEGLVVRGPQRYVRNPLYLSVVTITFGWGLLAGSRVFLVAALVFFLWFSLVLIPFEERELRALFGEEWMEYSRETPMLIPFARRRPKGRAG